MYAVFFYCDSKETKIQIFIYAVENRVSMCTQTHTHHTQFAWLPNKKIS